MKRLRCLFSFLLALIFACIPLQVILAASEAVRLAPTVNLYKRLVPGYEAPAYVGWAQSNRSALILIPRYTEGCDKSMRAELRFPDPSSNPYLAFAAMLAAALDGIDKKMTPPAPLNNVNLYELNREERREMGGIRPPVRIFILRSAVAQSPCVRASPSQLDILPFPPRLEPSPTHALAAPASLTQTM